MGVLGKRVVAWLGKRPKEEDLFFTNIRRTWQVLARRKEGPFMEDVHSMGLEAMAVLEARLRERGIVLTPEQEDELYGPMCEVLERVAGYPDYRHEH